MNQVTGASDKTIRQWDMNTGQCVLVMDILWAIAHPASTQSFYAPLSASNIGPGLLRGVAAAAAGFSVPTPSYADGSWDMYDDFVGGLQIVYEGLISGSGDGAVRMWDSESGIVSVFTTPRLMHIMQCGLDLSHELSWGILAQ